MYLLALKGQMRAEVERVCGGVLGPDHTHADHLALAGQVGGTNGAKPSAIA
jgi:hypothetical protein